ncbi:MAG TPA: HIT domain-containing protein [Ignavibacteriaceae bacterium]|nr:HIT domain-containing protein [Ignavibacteriaceae bacterium]
MNKLWSPWRTQYIESFKDKNSDTQCVFCSMKDEEPEDDNNLIVEKGELTFTVLNLYPYNNGHLMIVPYRHTGEFSSLTSEEKIEVMNKLQLSEKALTEVLHPEGFNIGANLGKVSGAGIHEHLHFHIVPRWNGDTNFMPVLGEVKVISQDLLVTKHNLIKAYKKLK